MKGIFCIQFHNVIELTVNERVKGDLSSHKMFSDLLSHLRNGNATVEDWRLLLQRTPANCENLASFNSALKLSYGNKKVAELNFQALRNLNSPVVKINAAHNKAAAAKFSTDDMGGLVPSLFLSIGARVMLTRNLWTDAGLVNGSLGTIQNIIYSEEQMPPLLPAVIIVQFDTYTGPSYLINEINCVPISPCSSNSESHGEAFERIQFPLKLAWAITIHKSQGLTLNNAWVDLGTSERNPGMSYVALSRVRNLENLVVESLSLERLQSIGKGTKFDLILCMVLLILKMFLNVKIYVYSV